MRFRFESISPCDHAFPPLAPSPPSRLAVPPGSLGRSICSRDLLMLGRQQSEYTLDFSPKDKAICIRPSLGLGDNQRNTGHERCEDDQRKPSGNSGGSFSDVLEFRLVDLDGRPVQKMQMAILVERYSRPGCFDPGEIKWSVHIDESFDPATKNRVILGPLDSWIGKTRYTSDDPSSWALAKNMKKKEKKAQNKPDVEEEPDTSKSDDAAIVPLHSKQPKDGKADQAARYREQFEIEKIRNAVAAAKKAYPKEGWREEGRKRCRMILGGVWDGEPIRFPGSWRPDSKIGSYVVHAGYLPRYGNSGVLMKLLCNDSSKTTKLKASEKIFFAAKVYHKDMLERPKYEEKWDEDSDIRVKLDDGDLNGKEGSPLHAAWRWLSCPAHPNVCMLHDILQDWNSNLVLITPWAEYGSMRDWANSLERVRGTLAPRLDACVQAATGVSHLHSLSGGPLVHGDIRLDCLLAFPVEQRMPPPVPLAQDAKNRTTKLRKHGGRSFGDIEIGDSAAAVSAKVAAAAAAAATASTSSGSRGGLRVIVRVGLRVPVPVTKGFRRRLPASLRYWRAPEIRKRGGGMSATTKADVWGLALCVLWTLGETGDEALYRIVHAKGNARSRAVEGALPTPLRARLAAVLASCLQDNPKDRPAMYELKKALVETYLMVTGRDPKPVKPDRLSSEVGPLGEVLHNDYYRLGRFHEAVLGDLGTAMRFYVKAAKAQKVLGQLNKLPESHHDLLRTMMKHGGVSKVSCACELFYHTLFGSKSDWRSGYTHYFKEASDEAVVVIGEGLRTAAQKGRLDLIQALLPGQYGDEDKQHHAYGYFDYYSDDDDDDDDDTHPDNNASEEGGEGGFVVGNGGDDDESSLALKLQDRIINYQPQDGDGSTALALAAKEGHYEVVKHLVLGRAQPFIGNKNKVTPLLRAAEGGSIEVREYVGKDWRERGGRT
eukprot:jgi/Bigna1/71009/fgenesh1_pg.14_\